MNSQIKTNIFSLTLSGFFQGSFHPFFFFLIFSCYLLPQFQQSILEKHLSGYGFMDIFLWCKAGLWSSHFPVYPLAPIPSVLPYICFCSCRMNWSRLKLRLRNQSRSKIVFLTGFNHFLKTHKGQQKDGTSSTRTGQVVVRLPLNIVLASSTLWLRDFLSQ